MKSLDTHHLVFPLLTLRCSPARKDATGSVLRVIIPSISGSLSISIHHVPSAHCWYAQTVSKISSGIYDHPTGRWCLAGLGFLILLARSVSSIHVSLQLCGRHQEHLCGETETPATSYNEAWMLKERKDVPAGHDNICQGPASTGVQGVQVFQEYSRNTSNTFQFADEQDTRLESEHEKR